jgi:hypothetical protein
MIQINAFPFNEIVCYRYDCVRLMRNDGLRAARRPLLEVATSCP